MFDAYPIDRVGEYDPLISIISPISLLMAVEREVFQFARDLL